MTELKLGVIGTGGRGGLAGHAHNPEEGVRITACCDSRSESLKWARKQYGRDIFTTKDYRKLLDQDVQAVFIASPDFLHEEQAVAALEAGKAVYLEKPMAITTEGCDRILETARAHKVKLYLGHNMRHFSVILKMKELIDAGAIGEVKSAWCRHFVSYGGSAYYKDWHADRTKSTGLLLQKGAHDIDVLHWLCGGYTQRVTAMGGLTVYGDIKDRLKEAEYGHASCGVDEYPPLKKMKGLHPVVDVEDLSMMLMQLDNGVFASYQQCHYTPDATRNYTVIGTEGRIENCGDTPGESVVKLWNRGQHYNAWGDIQTFIPRESGSHGGADPKIVAEFVRFVREGGKTNTSPVAARYSVAAGCAATYSLRNGNVPVDVEPVSSALKKYFVRQK